MVPRPERIFLGWDAPLLARAAAVLVERFRKGGAVDLSHAVVVLPGRRAARRLEDLLAELAGSDWIPPVFTTEAGLAQSLSRGVLRIAPALLNELAWAEALHSLPDAERARLFARAPDDGDRAGWLRWARSFAQLDASLALEGLDFAAVARCGALAKLPGERERWTALAAAKSNHARVLAAENLVDPARAGAAVIERGLVREDAEVVLVSLTDLPRAPRELLARLRTPPLALVFAPEDRAAGFDEIGALVPDAWCEREIPLRDDAWLVSSDYRDLSARAADWLAERAPQADSSDFAIGVLAAEIAPFLERELAARGASLRLAAGVPASGSAVVRALAQAQSYLATRSFASLAALARHPDVETALLQMPALAGVDLASTLDAYHAEHLPARADTAWTGTDAQVELLESLRRALGLLLGDLADGAERPLSQWSVPISALVASCVPSIERNPRDEAAWREARAVEAVAGALGELRELAGSAVDERTSAAGALDVLLARLEREALAPPPMPGAIEALGWLELALDDTPRLFLAGLNEGSLPQSSHGDAFLPDELCSELGLSHERRRLARDVHALTAILESRREVAAASARAGLEGDPLRPSRLLFHTSEEHILARVRRFYPEHPETVRRPADPDPETAFVPATPIAHAVRELGVSSFRTYLASPYLFYLEKLLRLKSVNDRARELDGLVFGSLAHAVLEQFGRSELRDSTRPEEIEEFLDAALKRQAAARFADNALSAVTLQLRALRRRLGRFAELQAERALAGWTIASVERDVSAIQLDVDGTPVRLKGFIDRVDHHRGRDEWCVIDYKTGDADQDPGRSHRKKSGEWLDLQLPLYAHMLRPEIGTRPLHLCYFNLPRDLDRAGIACAAWTADDLASALEAARDVVRGIRRGEFGEVGRKLPRERVLAALCGVGLLAPARDEGADDDDGEDE